MSISIVGLELSSATVALGAITGMVYGVSAVGLVLVYRSSRLINFAHGQVGTLGAAILGLSAREWNLPYWLAFLLALGVGAAVGGASEIVVARRLRDAPVIIGVIATLGLSQFLFLFSSIINTGATAGDLYPHPAGLPTFRIGGLLVTPAYSAMLLVTPLVVVALTFFLRHGRLGIAMRAAAANAEAARMAGVVSDRMSSMSWALAGALATYTAMLVLPARGYVGADFLGPGLLVRALVCVVVARMVNLPVALAAGVVLGVAESVLLSNYPNSGMVEAVMFVVIVVALLSQRTRTGRSEEKGSWVAVVPWSPLPESYQQVFAIRHLSRILALAGIAVGVLLPLVMSNATTLVLTIIAAFALVGLSVGIVTGLAGQLSLGQFALAGVGATVSVVVTRSGANFLVGMLAGGLAAAAVSLVLGLPALRVRGLLLAVTSLAFALAAQNWLFGQSWMLGRGLATRPPTLGPLRFDSGKSYYLVSLVVLVAGMWLANNVWRSGLGRRMRAVRDNEDAARVFTVGPTAAKLQAFVLGGFLAGVGGTLYGTALSRLSITAFPVDASINAAAMVVVGGLGVLIGPLLGALYVIGVPKFVPLDSAGLAATALGWLTLILQYPGGMAQGFARTRDNLFDALARRGGLDPVVERSGQGAVVEDWRLQVSGEKARRPHAEEPGSPLLEARDLTVRFGGLVAVDGVSLTVRRGETVGLIGPNGAGKTSLFELLSGFVQPNEGSVWFEGSDITGLSPERRSHLGLIRSFQDAALFPTMTVLEVVMLSLERVDPSRIGSSLLGRTRPEKRKEARARELVGAMGLYGYRDVQIKSLSTGTRRIAELACLVALEPTLLLLDEPTSGIAQRETEALGRLLTGIRDEFALTMAIIEHDIPLVMALSDRVVAMESGVVIADDSPDVVRNDARVIEAYLGGDIRAIERSTMVTSR